MRRRRELLLRYRDELERADEEIAGGDREPEEVQRATEQWDASVLASLGESDARALLEVVQALRRLDRGEYGVCVSCGETIAAARLDALPTAATCIECAAVREPRRGERAAASP